MGFVGGMMNRLIKRIGAFVVTISVTAVILIFTVLTASAHAYNDSAGLARGSTSVGWGVGGGIVALIIGLLIAMLLLTRHRTIILDE